MRCEVNLYIVRLRKLIYARQLLAFVAVFTFFLPAVITFAWPQGQAQDATQPSAQGQAAGAGRGRGLQPDLEHPVLPIGSPAPDFALTGVDGKIHTLSDYASAKILAIVFESNHCPVSQLYEGRIKQIYQDYKDKGVALVAINPNNASAIRLNELAWTDVTDSLAEMKIRVADRHNEWPYLYDGDTQAVALKFGAVATPHIFIFDQDRKLRYQGHIDDNQRPELVKSQDARNALDALLAGKPVPVETTRAFGCSTKWLSKSGDVQAEWAKIQAEPVKLDMAGVDDLKKLRENETGKVLLVNFWSTKCKECVSQFFDLETTYRWYRARNFTFVTVSTDNPKDSPAVLKFLQERYASSPNMQFATTDTRSLEAAFGEKWKSGEPFTMLIGSDGHVLYQKAGKADILEIRRATLANMPDGKSFIGNHDYWASEWGKK
jgi:peroxiredoxin